MQLFRDIGLPSAVFLVVGNIVGTGIFTTSGLISAELGSSRWLLGVWVLGGLLAMNGAVCYSLLGRRTPKAGGEYALVYPFYGPLPAFLAGWVSLIIGFSAPIAAVALGLAYYLTPFLPLGNSDSSLPLRLVAATAVVLVTVGLSLGLKFGSRLHSGITLLNLALALFLSFLVLSTAPVRENLVPALTDGGSGPGLEALAAAMLFVMFTYSGWNAAVYVVEEIRSPERNLPRALILGTVLVIVVYLLMNLAYLSAVPLEALQGRIPVAEIAAGATFGEPGGRVVNVLILFSMLSSLTAMSIAGPRVYFAMARNRLFPAWLSQVNPRRRIPLRAVWFQSAVALIILSTGEYADILRFTSGVLLLFAALTVSTLFRISRDERTSNPFWLLYRVLPALFIFVNLVILVTAVRSQPKGFLIGLAVLGLGLPVYYFYRRRGPVRPPSPP